MGKACQKENQRYMSFDDHSGLKNEIKNNGKYLVSGITSHPE